MRVAPPALRESGIASGGKRKIRFVVRDDRSSHITIGGLVIDGDGRTSRASSKGAAISAAKRGRTTRSELGLTLPQAAERVGLSTEPFRALVVEVGEKGVFHGLPIREGRGLGWRFDPVLLENDRQRAPRCTFPGCDKVAGPSGRCGEHAARAKYETVELICQWTPCGRRFTRPGSWLRELEGRGHCCSNACKGAAAYEARRADFREPFTSEASMAYHKGISHRIAADGQFDRVAAERSPLNLHRYSASHMCAYGPGRVREIDGARRWVCDPSDLVTWEPPWADRLERRVSIAYGRTKDPGVKGRLGGSIERKWTREQALDVLRHRAEGKTLGQIEYLTGLTKRQVRYILDG